MKAKAEKISIRIGRTLYENYPDSPAIYGFDEHGVAIDHDIPEYIFDLVQAVRNYRDIVISQSVLTQENHL